MDSTTRFMEWAEANAPKQKGRWDSDRRVLTSLASFADGDGFVRNVPASAMAQHLNLSSRTVRRSVAKLVEAGLITVIEQHSQGNNALYYVLRVGR